MCIYDKFGPSAKTITSGAETDIAVFSTVCSFSGADNFCGRDVERRSRTSRNEDGA